MTHIEQIEVYWRQRSHKSRLRTLALLSIMEILLPSTEARLAGDSGNAAGLHADKQTAPD